MAKLPENVPSSFKTQRWIAFFPYFPNSAGYIDLFGELLKTTKWTHSYTVMTHLTELANATLFKIDSFFANNTLLADQIVQFKVLFMRKKYR